MTEETLKTNVGSVLQLQATVPENSPRYQVKVIGYLPGVSLVVTTPTVNGKVQIIREGITFNVRMLSGSDVVGFPAKVLQSAVKPYPHLHLEYPKNVESINVRNACRVSTKVPVTVRNLSEPEERQTPINSILTDLSHTGAGVVSQFAPLANPGDVVRLQFSVELIDTVEPMELTARVRRLRETNRGSKDEQRYFHGVEFSALERYQQVLLHAWVLERLTAEESRQF